jgi:hypothetical protein
MTNRVDHYSSRLSDHPRAEHARAHLLRLLAVDLVKSGVTRLVLESRDDRDTHDRSVLRAVLGTHPPLVYEHVRKHEEPLLTGSINRPWVAQTPAAPRPGMDRGSLPQLLPRHRSG